MQTLHQFQIDFEKQQIPEEKRELRGRGSEQGNAVVYNTSSPETLQNSSFISFHVILAGRPSTRIRNPGVDNNDDLDDLDDLDDDLDDLDDDDDDDRRIIVDCCL